MNPKNTSKMKKYIFTLLALLCCLDMTAQTDGCLIVKEYSPDEWHILQGRTYIDMDDDGEMDFEYYAGMSSTHMAYPAVYAKNGSCFHITTVDLYSHFVNTFVDIEQPLNDTSLRWRDPNEGTIIHPEACYYGQYHLDTMTFKAGIRNGEEGEYYYGWLEAYCVVSYNYSSVWFYLARTCYCTIPNYPLRWGQTRLNEGFEETEATAFANIYPNPTKNTFTVTGKDLKQAEVLNMLGQRVTTATGQGETLHIDIANLPTGVYFVRITDEEGRKCVRKVVKE